MRSTEKTMKTQKPIIADGKEERVESTTRLLSRRRMIELEENPYERVYKIDSQLTQLNEQLKTITAQIGALELKKGGVYQVGKRGAKAIGEVTGQPQDEGNAEGYH